MSRITDEVARAALSRLSDGRAVDLVHRRRDLLALGISDTEQSAMFRRGMLVRLRHGVYAMGERVECATPAELHRIHLAAAIAAADKPTWAFGASAALVHELPLPCDVPDALELLRHAKQDERSLARVSRHRIELPGVRVTTHVVSPRDVTTVQGIAVVDRVVAAISAARQVSHRRRVAVFDAVLWDGTLSADDLYRVCDEWRSRGGKAEIDSAIARARRGAQTVLETLSRLALVDQGLPEPQLQVAFHDRVGLIGYVDMYWPDLRVIGEADGRVKYASRDDVVREKVREDRLRALGLPVVRWMWDDIRDRPAEVARRIREASRRAT